MYIYIYICVCMCVCAVITSMVDKDIHMYVSVYVYRCLCTYIFVQLTVCVRIGLYGNICMGKTNENLSVYTSIGQGVHLVFVVRFHKSAGDWLISELKAICSTVHSRNTSWKKLMKLSSPHRSRAEPVLKQFFLVWGVSDRRD